MIIMNNGIYMMDLDVILSDLLKKCFPIKGKSDIYNATNGTSSNVITIT